MSGLKDLLEHVSEDVLQRILASFSAATGLHAIIVDRDGTAQVPANCNGDCSFCRTIKSDPVGRNKCRGSYSRAGLQAAQYGEPYIFRCHAGLVAFAAPIVIDGELIGSIICGQVLMWEPEDFFWEEIREMTSGLNIRQDALIKAAGELEVISGLKVQAASELLFVMANHIMQSGRLALQQRKEIALRQTQLSDEIRQRKRLEERLAEVHDSINGHKCIQRERELMAAVRVGDKEKAYELLNELVSECLQQYISNHSVFRARAMELLVLISRSAAEGGAERERLVNLNSQYIDDFAANNEPDVLANWVFEALDRYISCVNGNVNIKYLEIIEKAKEFIREKYCQNLTLNDIAQACFISPYHLSHIFREQLNCTVMDYLTKVRMEEAKKLLQNPHFTINDIAEQTGYSDPGYFCKVFKKNEGVTPSSYKKQMM